MNDNILASLQEKFNRKKILILGFGKEGRSTYGLLRSLNCDMNLYIMDQNEAVAEDYLDELKDVHTRVLDRTLYLKGMEAYDYIFKTPGLPGYLVATVTPEKITSQTELFLEFLGGRTVGVTGTKGKSTTSSLLAYILESKKIGVKLVGNIGSPALESLLNDDGKTIYIYEMSSFQTEFLHVGPRVGIILNMFEEHLNNYNDFIAYQDSKLQLFKAHIDEPEKQSLIYGCDNRLLADRIRDLRSYHDDRKFYTFGYLQNNEMKDSGCFIDGEEIIYLEGQARREHLGNKDFPRKMLGEHNLINSLVGFVVMERLAEQGLIGKIERKEIIALIAEFKGLPHRLEEVGTYQGIRFYNDSISTIPEATMKAIEAVDNLQTLIVGGFDRKINYTKLGDYLNRLKQLKIILLPETGSQILKMITDKTRCYPVSDMEEAVEKAYQITDKGKCCLLSPAASSYNQYKNFQERGDHFTQCVMEGVEK